MPKSNRPATADVLTMPTVTTPIETVIADDIARRAYELYEAHGNEHGHDLDDWLQAERELRTPLQSTAA